VVAVLAKNFAHYCISANYIRLEKILFSGRENACDDIFPMLGLPTGVDKRNVCFLVVHNIYFCG